MQKPLGDCTPKATDVFSSRDFIRTPGMRAPMDRLIELGWIEELTPSTLTVGDDWPDRLYRITDAGRSAGCTVGPRKVIPSRRD